MGTGMRISLLPLLAAILILFPLTTHSQRFQLPPPRPLCTSQYTLANYACTHLPYRRSPPPSPPSPPPSPPPPPPSPSAPPSPDDDSSHRHRHSHHGHHHSHSHRHREHREHQEATPVEAECCKWMQQMDAECVCDLLVHLPPFLARPMHNYTVLIDDFCSVTYSCGGRIIR